MFSNTPIIAPGYLAGTNAQIDQSKGSSSLTAAKIRANINALTGADAGQTVVARAELQQSVLASAPKGDNASIRETIHPTPISPTLKLSEQDLFESVSSVEESLSTGAPAVSSSDSISETVWEDFRQWIDAI
ncbi:MAG: hypothetical protein ABGZ53_06445 [Fuerstiella sp.]